MANMKIVQSAKEKLTSEEWLQVQDYIISTIKYEDRKNYSKGYQAGLKRSRKTGFSKEGEKGK